MVRSFRFAVQCLDFGDRDVLLATADQAERLGYEELFTADHVGAPDPFAPLVVVAEATTRLRLGPLVLNNELHHPALIARSVATADRLSGGRVVLGIGTGYMRSEHEATGIELRDPGPRVSRFEESVIVLRSLLDENSVSFTGDHFRIDLDDLGIRPDQPRVPLLVGGHGRRVIGIGGRHADIFQFTGLTYGPGGVPVPGGFGLEEIRERAHWLVDAAGDRTEEIERSVLVQVTKIDTGVEERIREIEQRVGLTRSTIEETPFLLLGSVEQVVDKLERLREDLGITHYVVRDAVGFAPVLERLGVVGSS